MSHQKYDTNDNSVQGRSTSFPLIARTKFMDNADILTKIRASLIERFGLEASQLAENARLRDLGADSMHILEIMLDLETELGVSLSDLSLPPNPTLGEVAAAISRNLAGPA
jgi:acyl carrier protein